MQGIGAGSITGIASGLDTNAIVEAIIGAERGTAVLLEIRQAEKTKMISAYKAIEARFLAIQSKLGLLSKGVTFDKMSITSSDEDGIEVGAGENVVPGTFDVRVTQLARNNQLASQGFDKSDDKVLGAGTFQFAVGSASMTTVTLTSSNNSLTGLRDAINSADAGVSASIVNDGTEKNSFRLILTSSETGSANKITIKNGLSGGSAPDFVATSFDVPETGGFSATASSLVTLGSTASYTGAENKTYTFTVAGSGTQTVGTDIITLNYTDGTNSGSIVVTQADIEVALAGTGSDGLKLSFSAGDLVAGDTFTVSTFAPILQNPTDAKITIGSTGGGGAPIEIVSSSNEFKDALPGLNLTAKQVTLAGQTITISAARDVDGVKQEVNGFISAYNDAMKFIDSQFSFDVDTKRSGVLISEGLLRNMQERVRSAATGIVGDLKQDMNTLATIGIRSGSDGQLKIANNSAFEKAVKENSSALKVLFGDNIVSDKAQVELLTAGNDSKAGVDYKLDITQAATSGTLSGATIPDPATTPLVINSTNNKLTLKVDGRTSNAILLTEGTYSSFDQLVREIQKRIDADSEIGKLKLVVSSSASSGTGRIVFTSGSFGASSSVNLDNANTTAGQTLGLSFSGTVATVGKDVAGTINGEKATGAGQILTGAVDNKTTDGLKLRITFGPSDVVDNEEATFTLTKGVASKLKDTLFRIVDSADGSLSRRVKALTAQAEDIGNQVSKIDERLVLRRQRLIEQFRQMEQVLGQLNSQSGFLAGQLSNLTSNFSR
jgi:flagellar hook-associated protein 2